MSIPLASDEAGQMGAQFKSNGLVDTSALPTLA